MKSTVESLLKPGLVVVFCTSKPDSFSRHVGIPRAHPKDPFWSNLGRYLIPFRGPRSCESSLEWGVGHIYLSDVSARSKLLVHRPRVMVVLGRKCACRWLGLMSPRLGLQRNRHHGIEVYILPSRPRPQDWQELSEWLGPWLPHKKIEPIANLEDLRNSVMRRPGMYFGSLDGHGFLTWIRMLLAESLRYARSGECRRIHLTMGDTMGQSWTLEDDGPPWDERAWQQLDHSPDHPVDPLRDLDHWWPWICAAMTEELRREPGCIRLRLKPEFKPCPWRTRSFLRDQSFLYPGVEFRLTSLDGEHFFCRPRGLAQWVEEELYDFPFDFRLCAFSGEIPGGSVRGVFSAHPLLATRMCSFVNGERSLGGGSHERALLQALQIRAEDTQGIVAALEVSLKYPYWSHSCKMVLRNEEIIKPIRELVLRAMQEQGLPREW